MCHGLPTENEIFAYESIDDGGAFDCVEIKVKLRASQPPLLWTDKSLIENVRLERKKTM